MTADFDFVKLQDSLKEKEEKTYSRYKRVEVDSSKNKIEVNFEAVDLFILMHFQDESVKVKIKKDHQLDTNKVIKVSELKQLLLNKGLEAVLDNLKKHPALKIMMKEKIKH